MVVSPDPADKIRAFWESHQLPFSAIADPTGRILKMLGQESNWLKFGRMPALVAVGPDGHVLLEQRGKNMADTPNFTAIVANIARAGVDPS